MYYPPGGRGVRLDSHVYAGYVIPSAYDSMIAKLITHGKDRREAMDKMSRALGEYMITGVKTTIPFEQAILQDPNFRRGVYSTSFIDELLSGARGRGHGLPLFPAQQLHLSRNHVPGPRSVFHLPCSGRRRTRRA
jgi:acetyl-CoA carboxylase, biotin carboxylase subunit